MGVDFYSCNYCGETFPDCGDYVSCGDDCWKHWCCEECAEEDGYRVEEEPENWDEEEDGEWYEGEHTTCNYCRKEDHDDDDLLGFSLELLHMSREELIQRYNEELSKGEK